jgi:CheY-like chemotaxis protein
MALFASRPPWSTIATVPSVLVGIDDASAGGELVEALERARHQVTWVGALDVGPDARSGRTPDVIVVDGDAPGMDLAVVAAAWKRLDPSPALVVLGSTAATRIAAERIRATVIAKPFAAAAVAEEVGRVASAPRGRQVPTAAEALRVLGLASGGLPEDEAATIIAGSRHVDAGIVREALRPHIDEYVTAEPLLDQLCARRALTASEATFAVNLDGSRTVRGVIDTGGLPGLAAARLIWALVCGGAVSLSQEPPTDDAHPAARRVAMLRDHLRARRDRVARGATSYDILEVTPDAQPVEIDRAAQLFAVRFAPDRFAAIDLGDLAGLVEPIWRQVLRARALLLDPGQRQKYDAQLLVLAPDADTARMRRRIDASDAEQAFLRGQRALASGDAFKAVSELASAARRLPDEPDYEAYAAWARVCADEARSRDRLAAARRERAVAETALLGRKPRPRALFALALLCEAAGDLDAAREALRDALACDPRLSPARQMLTRLGG